MEHSLPALIGAFGSLFGVLFLFVLAALAVSWPFLVWSVVRNIRRIANELQRANDYREHYDHGVRSGPLGT